MLKVVGTAIGFVAVVAAMGILAASPSVPMTSPAEMHAANAKIEAQQAERNAAYIRSTDFARTVGDINGARITCDFKFTKDGMVYPSILGVYLNEKRDDLLMAHGAAVRALQVRYEQDPVKTCQQARADHWMTFER